MDLFLKILLLIFFIEIIISLGFGIYYIIRLIKENL